MKKSSSKAQLLTVLKESGDAFKLCARKAKILPTLSWQSEVCTEFFRKKESVLPKPTYAVDRKSLTEVLEVLNALEPKLKGEHPVYLWLRRTRESFKNGVQLLLELEGPGFYPLCSEMYGASKTKVFNGELGNLELARAISQRMAVPNMGMVEEHQNLKTAEQFAIDLEEKIRSRHPVIPVKVEVTDGIVAKVVAGMARVRIRKDAKFSEQELEGLWNHEIESHCLTAHNGSRHMACDFLSSAGPRTTMTQEGLAVFYEVFGHSMSQRRFLSLCDRVEAVHKVEEGANFIDLYRWYKERSESEIEAFYNTQRVFRGAKLEGGGPFTKDVVYLAGLLGVYNFLRIAVKSQNRLLVETLICGRMALEDVGTIAWLRAHGIVNPPYFLPHWLQNWEALLSFFSLTAVLGAVDLSNVQNYFDDHYTLQDWDLSV